MKIFALIKDTIVHNIAVCETVELAENLWGAERCLDITDMIPRPAIGDRYDKDTATFTQIVSNEPEVTVTPQEKLARAGLTVDELKSLLGL